MKILLVNNSALRCGVASYGRNLAAALRGLGHEVHEYHADRTGGFLAADHCAAFDVALINWMAGTLGFLRPCHIPDNLPVTMYFHESFNTNNRPRCPIWDCCQVVFTPEPCSEGAVVVPHPCPDITPVACPYPTTPILANSSIRREGAPIMDEAARRNGWQTSYSDPSRWVSYEDEVDRLARATCGVYLYTNGFGGQSGGVMTSVSARRPIVLSRGRQFESLFPHEDELYFAEVCDPDHVEWTVRKVLADIDAGREKRPTKLAHERSWSESARIYERHLLRIAKR